MAWDMMKKMGPRGGWGALGGMIVPGLMVAALLLCGAPAGAMEPDWDFASPPDIFTATAARIAGDVDGDGFSDLIVGYPEFYSPEFTYAGSGLVKIIYGAANGPGTGRAETVLFPEWNGDNFGAAVSTAGDVDGDGYDDVLIGWPNYSFPEPDNAGRAYVYYGGPAGLDTAHRWHISGTVAQTLLGTKVAGVGDVDADGYADIMVAGRESAPVLIYGSSSGPGTRRVTIPWPHSTHSANTFGPAGDLNADGVADFVLGEPVAYLASNNKGRVSIFLGHAGGVAATPSQVVWQLPQDNELASGLGALVGLAGDVNGDGYGDLLVGSTDDGWINDGILDRRGRFLVYAGDAGGINPTPIWWHYNPSPEEMYAYPEYGLVADTAGDFNGDGFADLVLVSPYHDAFDGATYQNGLIQFFYGGRGGPDASVSEQYEGPEHTETGTVTACAGDLNGDGYGDVIFTGQPGTSLCGFAGRGNDLDRLRQWQLNSIGYGAQIGKTVAVLGDINGDGFSDAAVGAPIYLDGRGQVQVFLGTEFGLASSAQFSTFSASVDNKFGEGLSRAGDLNGDGYEDLLVGAPGVNGHGAVYAYFGSATGFSSPADWVVEGSQDQELFGSAVLGGFDSNGDGYADVLVGAPQHTDGSQYEGRCRLYLGGPAGPQTTAQWEFASDDWMSFTGAKLATAGDVNRDGYADVLIGAPYHRVNSSPSGRVYLFLGSAGGLEVAPNWQKDAANEYDSFGSGLGHSDLNRDGYSDVIIGVPNLGSTGRVEVYGWTGSTLDSSPFYYVYGPTAGHFGAVVAGAGDVNGDGYGDAIIGAPAENRAYLLLGGFSHNQGLPSHIHLSDWQSWDSQNCDEFNDYAQAVAGGGDFNGDGFADVLVGDPGYHANGNSQGIAYTYLGNGLNELGGRPLDLRQNYGLPIPLKGSSPSASTFYLNAEGFSPCGRSEVRLSYRVVNTGLDPADGTTLSTIWLDSGSVSGGASSTGLTAIVNGLQSDTGYQWQARIESDNPLFPRSPWRTCTGATPFEMHLKTAGPPPQPDLTVALTTPDTADGGSPTTMTATVANYGLTTAGASLARVLLNGSETCGGLAVPSLAAGATFQISCDLGYLPGGNNLVTVQVDTGNAVSEADENNNSVNHFINTTNYFTIYLQADGSGTFATIQAAIDAVNPGGTISLGDGTYTGVGNRDLQLRGKTVTVKSGSGNTAACVLDAYDSVPGQRGHFVVAAGEILNLQGVTLTRGNQENGGAVQVGGTFRPTDVTFNGNESNLGGAVCGQPGSVISATDCRFLMNLSMGEGGAVDLNQSTGFFTGTVFDGNYAYDNGGAVRVYGATAFFGECLLSGNIAEHVGGAVSTERPGAEASFDHCTLSGNTAGQGGHLWLVDGAVAGGEWSIFAFAGGGGAIDHAEAEYSVLECCNVFGNTGGDFINLWEDYAGGADGCFSADPLFCDAGAGSFSLQAESPCATGDCGLVGAFPVGCALIYSVAADGSGDFPTIQAAVNGVPDGSIIELLDGVFTDQGNGDVAVVGRRLTFRSQSGDSTACVIDVRGSSAENHRAFNLTGGADVTLQGVTLRGGFHDQGAAVYLSGSALAMERVVVTGNTSREGAIYATGATALAVHWSTFSGNVSSYSGAAVGLRNSPGVFTACGFTSNRAADYGGAVSTILGSVVELIDCLLVNNGAGQYGGAVCLFGGQGSVTGCTFWGGDAADGSSVASLEGAHADIVRCILGNGEGSAVYTGVPDYYDGTVAVSCCDAYENVPGDWVEALAGMEGVDGNFSADPLFCDPGHGVMTLRSDSPCLPGGNSCYVVIGTFGVGCQASSAAPEVEIPRQSYLAASVPNPFNPQTVLSFGLAAPGRTSLVIYDLSGRKVCTLVDQELLPAGVHSYSWNGRDDGGRNVAAGIYLYRVQAGDYVSTRKMTLLK